MAKGIYVIKMYIFQDQFILTEHEKKYITDLALFVSLIYIKFWNEAPIGPTAPQNDIKFLEALQCYPNKEISKVAFKAFSRHLWYLSEHLIGLAFFDENVSNQVKIQMAKNINVSKNTALQRRIKITEEEQQLKIENFVSDRTFTLFNVLHENGEQMAKEFLNLNPSLWSNNKSYVELKKRSYNMNVVNDVAERGVSLAEKYNETLTKDEDQKQLLLRSVENHRKKISKPNKNLLMS